MKPLIRIVLLLGLAGLVACSQPSSPSGKPFTYALDPSILSTSTSPDGAPLAALQDSSNRKAVFVSNEVIVTPKTQEELNAFVSKYGGTIVANDAVPTPPKSLNITLDPKETVPTFYVVKLDASSFSTSSFNSDAQKVGFGGNYKLSSDTAAKLLALVMKEKAAGLDISPNQISEQRGLLFSTQEHPKTGGGFEDAFAWSRFAATGSKSNVQGAWQLVAAKPPAATVNVAVIDGGFWLDGGGHPMSSGGGVSDLPSSIAQYDFHDNDYLADGPSLSSCTDGFVCNWHGNSSAGVAVGTLNNSYGGAGTGGQVGVPFLFKVGSRFNELATAIRTAADWGADVISVSMGGDCPDFWCEAFDRLYPAERHADERGVVMVAAAGNHPVETNDVPCRNDHVICVGALGDDTNTAIDYSSYGRFVDIWAPTNIPALPNPETGGGIDIHGGTSAATPFVAGIAAMVKAYSRSLNSDAVRDLLRRNAWTDSTDSKVTHYVNAYRAVREAMGPNFPADAAEANNTPLTATALGAIGSAASPTRRDNLTLTNSADRDHFRLTLTEYAQLTINLESMPALGNLTLSLVKESGALGTPQSTRFGPRSDARGFEYQAGLVPPGTYRIVVTGDNSNAYNLVVSKLDRPLLSDRFEVNDTLATATGLPSPGFGTYGLNLHNLTDADFFFFNPANTVVNQFFVKITNQDMPLTLRLYDNTNAEVSNLACPNSTNCSMDIPNGVHRVKVEGAGARGNYFLNSGYRINRSALLPNFVLFPDTPIRRIDPGDPPIPGWLEGLQDVFAFQQVGKASKGILIGLNQAFKLSLLDASGKVVASGQSNNNPQTPGLEVPLSGLQTNAYYVLLVERANPAVSVDGESETLGALPYTLSLGN